MFPRDDNEPRLISWLRNPRVRRTIILTLLWLFIGTVLALFMEVLLPFGLAVLLAFIMEPAVSWATQRRIRGRPVPRIAAILAIYLVIGTSTAIMGSWGVAQVGRELVGVGALSRTFLKETKVVSKQILDRAETFAAENNIPIHREEIEQVVQRNLISFSEELSDNAASILTLGRNLVGGAFSVVFGSFLVLMLAAFMSMDRKRIERFFFSLVPPENQSGYTAIMSGASIGLAGVVRGQVLICLTNGALTFVGLWILGVKLPLILAILAAIFSLIPIFGSIISTIPIVALALTDGLGLGLLALSWIIGVHLLEANFLNPKIMGESAKIHPVVVVFALIVGERTAGLMGALFAVPIASVLITVFKFLHRRALEVRPDHPPPLRTYAIPSAHIRERDETLGFIRQLTVEDLPTADIPQASASDPDDAHSAHTTLPDPRHGPAPQQGTGRLEELPPFDAQEQNANTQTEGALPPRPATKPKPKPVERLPSFDPEPGLERWPHKGES
ncbi:MAG: AI-2E family transporter [Deltaproteobacteria bacterium]|nr:AI-2E family transporter [Deltaproteobacteria bacterium]